MKEKRSRSWLYEAPLFYLALLTLQRAAFPADPGFRSANPNPLWLGLLLFGLRYGLAAGLGSGLISAALFLLGARQAGEGYRLLDADFYVQPGLFIVVGAALGAVADRFEHALFALKLRLEDLDGRNRGLQNQLQAQEKALRAVEQQVVSQMSSVVTLYQGSRELGTLDRAALLPAILEFFTRALDASKTSLYVPEDGRWRLLDSRGWSRPDEHPSSVAPGSGVIGRAAAEGRIVTVKDALAAAAASDALMAAPVLDPSGAPAAVFAVHEMPFLRFNSAAVSLLALLAEWGAQSLAKCAQVQDLRDRSLFDEDLGVHSARYFAARLSQEMARSKRFSLPLSILLLRARADIPAERRPALIAVVARAAREECREIDIVARSPYEAADVAVLLPTTTREGAGRFLERLREALGRLELPARIDAGLGSYRAGMAAVEDIADEATRALG